LIFTDPYSGTGGDTHFAKEPYKRDEILQKSPTIVRRLLIVATPYQHIFAISIFIFRYWRGHIFSQVDIDLHTHLSAPKFDISISIFRYWTGHTHFCSS